MPKLKCISNETLQKEYKFLCLLDKTSYKSKVECLMCGVSFSIAHGGRNNISIRLYEVIMGLNNKLAELQSRYDFTKAEALRWESALSHIKLRSSEKALELERVRTTCWTMYQNICRRRKMEPTVEENDVEEQLITIKRTIHELKKIVRVARRRSAREAASQIIS